jgi:hypothetical protein
VAAILLAVLAAAGCQGLLGLGAVIMGTDESAEFAGLKEKKVAVVCRPLVSLQYRNAGAARELAQQVGLFLSANVPKINVIDSQKVASWIDENTWDDYVEVGKALKADCVIGIDLMSFSVLEGQTLYRGRSAVAFKVYDVATGKTLFEKTLPETVYPPNIALPASERPEGEFRSEFVKIVAWHVARHFYKHDAYGDTCLDTKAGIP